MVTRTPLASFQCTYCIRSSTLAYPDMPFAYIQICQSQTTFCVTSLCFLQFDYCFWSWLIFLTKCSPKTTPFLKHFRDFWMTVSLWLVGTTRCLRETSSDVVSQSFTNYLFDSVLYLTCEALRGRWMWKHWSKVVVRASKQLFKQVRLCLWLVDLLSELGTVSFFVREHFKRLRCSDTVH